MKILRKMYPKSKFHEKLNSNEIIKNQPKIKIKKKFTQN